MNLKKLVVLGAVAFGSNFGMAQCLISSDYQPSMKREIDSCETVLNKVSYEMNGTIDYFMNNKIFSGAVQEALSDVDSNKATPEAKTIKEIYLKERTKIINNFLKENKLDKTTKNTKESEYGHFEYDLSQVTRNPVVSAKTKAQVLEMMNKLREPVKKYVSSKLDM